MFGMRKGDEFIRKFRTGQSYDIILYFYNGLVWHFVTFVCKKCFINVFDFLAFFLT